MSVRISLDLSSGTFSKVEAISRERFQNKASYLRQLIDQDIAKREGKAMKRAEEGQGKK